jgi:hypothetical protein
MNSADRELQAALRALNEGAGGAPERIERALRAAYRAKHPQRRWKYALPLAAAATLAVALLPEQPPVAPPPPDAPAPPAFAFAVPLRQPAPAPPPVPPSPRAAVSRAPAVAAQEFVPLHPGSSLLPLERAQLLRVEIPRSALAPAGFPVDPVRLHERVRADVLMGEDGLIRGIRFVR